MAMPYYRTRLVRDHAAFFQRAKIHLEIATAVRGRSDIQRGIEPSNPVEQLSPERHVGTGAETPRPMVPSADVPRARESAPKAAVTLEILLCRTFQLVWNHEPCHDMHMRRA